MPLAQTPNLIQKIISLHIEGEDPKSFFTENSIHWERRLLEILKEG